MKFFNIFTKFDTFYSIKFYLGQGYVCFQGMFLSFISADPDVFSRNGLLTSVIGLFIDSTKQILNIFLLKLHFLRVCVVLVEELLTSVKYIIGYTDAVENGVFVMYVSFNYETRCSHPASFSG